jgi:hypothetical protein
LLIYQFVVIKHSLKFEGALFEFVRRVAHQIGVARQFGFERVLIKVKCYQMNFLELVHVPAPEKGTAVPMFVFLTDTAGVPPELTPELHSYRSFVIGGCAYGKNCRARMS